MKNRICAVGAIALGAASLASADFSGWTATVSESGGYYVMNIYAAASSGSDEVLNVFNLNVHTNAANGFHQASTNPFWAPSAGQNLGASLDSWITLGTHDDGTAHEGTVADANLTNFDNSNGAQDFTCLDATGAGAGWGVGNPNSSVTVAKAIFGEMQGAQSVFGVLVAHFVVSVSDVTQFSTVTFSGSAIYNGSAVGADDQTFSWVIPGPGAAALLALGGLVSTRRRPA